MEAKLQPGEQGHSGEGLEVKIHIDAFLEQTFPVQLVETPQRAKTLDLSSENG